MFNTNASIFSFEQLLPNNCVFEMRNFKQSNKRNKEEQPFFIIQIVWP